MLKDAEKRVRSGGFIVLDSFTVKEKSIRDDLKLFYIPATEIALDIGNRQ